MPLPELEQLLYDMTILGDKTFPLATIGRVRQISKWHSRTLASPVKWKRLDDGVDNCIDPLFHKRRVGHALQALGWPRFGGAHIIEPNFSTRRGVYATGYFRTECYGTGNFWLTLSTDAMGDHMFIRLTLIDSTACYISVMDTGNDTAWNVALRQAIGIRYKILQLEGMLKWSELSTDFKQCVHVAATAAKTMYEQNKPHHHEPWCETRGPGSSQTHFCRLDDFSH